MKRIAGTGRFVARLRKKPYVVTLHGGVLRVPAAEAERMLNPIRGKFEWGRIIGRLLGSRRVLDDADGIICVDAEEAGSAGDGAGRFMANQLQRNGVPSPRTCVLPFAVPPAAPSAEERSREAERGDTAKGEHSPVRLLFVGQLVRGKGVDNLLGAFRDLLGRNLPAGLHLDVVGSGNAADSLANSVGSDPLLRAHVTFHGWTPPEKINRFYRNADIVVVPSRWPEPFGIVGLEAMRNGKPVVAFSVGGIPDWLEDGVTGVLVPPADEAAAFAGALESLSIDPHTREKYGNAARQRIGERFTFDRYVDNLIEALEGRCE